MWRKLSTCFLPLVLLVLTTGCQLSQTAFLRMAGDAGSAFEAASITLQYTHEGKITTAYASSSFINFQSELSNLDQVLPSQNGAPNKRTIQHLLALSKPAMQAINTPCLDTSCNWQAQITVLNRASEAFLKAGGQ